nr:MAG TPA_asm: hypothetical protein [Bacteriophage sp.]
MLTSAFPSSFSSVKKHSHYVSLTLIVNPE